VGECGVSGAVYDRPAVRLAPLFIAAAFASSALAQDAKPNPRYEIMWRMRELDRAWMAQSATEARSKADPFAAKAWEDVHRGDIAAAAEALDAARGEFMSPWWPHPRGLLWPDCLGVARQRCLLDSKGELLQLRIAHLYGSDNASGWFVALGSGARVDWIEPDNLLVFGANRSTSWDVDVKSFGPGDHQLELEIADGDFVWSRRPVTFSIVENRDARLTARVRGIGALQAEGEHLERVVALAEGPAGHGPDRASGRLRRNRRLVRDACESRKEPRGALPKSLRFAGQLGNANE